MPTSYEFADFRLDPGRRTLMRFNRNGAARPVAIGGRALDLLLVLIEHAGQVLSARVLLQSVWPGRTVEDSNLTVQLLNLRRALEIDASAPRLIKTVHGRGYLLTATVNAQGGQLAARAGVCPDRPRIAVLPFRGQSGKPEQGRFGIGLGEDITAALSCMRSLPITARYVTASHSDSATHLAQAGPELGARYVLSGSVRRAGNRARVTAYLADLDNGSQIWSGRFDGLISDGFELEDRIAADIARALEPELLQAEIARARTCLAPELTAREAYLKAFGMFLDFSEPSLRRALQLLDRAIVADPSYAAAYGLAAWCCRLLVNYVPRDDKVIRRHGASMARLAVSFGRDDPFALSLGGSQIALLGGDHDAGLKHIERALTLDEDSARAWELSGWVSASVGQHQRSIECFQHAIRLGASDRLSALPYAGIAWPYFFMGRYDEAIANADKACVEMPDAALPLRPKIASAAMAGRIKDVRQASQRLRAIIGDLSIERLMQIDVSRSQGQRDAVEEALRRAGIAG